MKKLKDFTNEEKINAFDLVYKSTLDEWNESGELEDWDEHYFWEEMMEKVLDVTQGDYERRRARSEELEKQADEFYAKQSEKEQKRQYEALKKKYEN